MKVAFPYMGNIHIPLGALLRALGAETIIPPPPDIAAMNHGIRLAPELMCIPFKITLGNFVRALELGADTLAYGSGTWSCRYGYYFRLQHDILHDLGYEFDLITLHGGELPDLWRRVKALSGNRLPRALLRSARAFRIGWLKSTAVDQAERLSRWYRPREIIAGSATRLYRRYLKELDATDSPGAVARLTRQMRRDFEDVEIDPDRRPLKIKVVGESFCLLEPFVNLNVLERLGTMGVWADPTVTTHHWLGFHALRIGNREQKQRIRLAQAHWAYNVGGDDLNAVAYTLEAARQGYDGVLHLHPFGCMPGTVVGPVLARISSDRNLPLLDIALDEQTSEAGFYTRIDAFLSVIEKRRKAGGKFKVQDPKFKSTNQVQSPK